MKPEFNILNFSRKKYSENYADFAVIILTVVLTIFGVIMVFSASYYKSINDTGSPYSYLWKQLFFAISGFVIMYMFSKIDYHLLKKLNRIIAAGSLALLALVIIPGVGTTVNGSTRWLNFGPMTIMPGEVAKVAVICFLASYFSDNVDKIKTFKGIVTLILATLLPVALIIKQPNLSTALTVLGIAFGIAFVAGLSWKWVAACIGMLGVLIMYVAGSDGYQAERIKSFMDPFADPKGDGFHAVQSLLALGTGGIKGLGLGKSVQKNLYLPEPQNDFIFAIVGEELGLIGALVFIVVMILLIYKCFMTALDAKDSFGMLIASGITFMIGIQVILNIAVVTSSMPPTGIALPFISYGGNSLWIFMASMGVLLNIGKQGRKAQPVSDEDLMKSEEKRRLIREKLRKRSQRQQRGA